MRYNSKVAFRTVIWIALPFLFTSYVSPGPIIEAPLVIEGNYSLTMAESPDLDLSGTIDFRTAIEYSDNGIPFSTLKLKLRNRNNDNIHSLGFLISEQNNARQLPPGNYKVPGKIEGLLHNFDGVFGFANIQALGELPFFAESGGISISKIGPRILHGTMEVKLRNSEGKQLNIKGNFTAIRRIIE